MKSEVIICGIGFAVEKFQLYQKKVFPGCGELLGTAIMRPAKNRYTCVAIATNDRVSICDLPSIHLAIEWIQKVYITFGNLPGVR